MLPARPSVDRSRRRPRVAAIVVAAVACLLAALPVLTAPAALADANAPIFSLPAQGDLLGEFERNDYNEQDGAPEQVAAPDMPGRQALRFTLEGGEQRSELLPRIPYQREGDLQYYAYSGYLAPDFPVDADGWQILLQWHQFSDEGSPPIAVEVRDGRLVLSEEGRAYQDLGPARPGAPIDLVLRIRFSEDPDEGVVDVWNAGEHVLQEFRPESGTLLDEGNYLKVGYYRSTSIDETGTVYLDDLRVGPTAASVGGRATSNIPAGELETGPSPASDTSSTPIVWLAVALVALVLVAVVIRLRRDGHVRR
ncbi:polysaccharide lyase [Actinomycetospora cinnamomea]|uniref:Polysaccharide lyase-like protein n=1 Tax=Actinomycetospora cinnamomea TaxID=663609 RepID=A0A2U1F738_9PSEU|nr:polysaccharide lyase [Actinomycetospora cinnamomea]PVZ07979.1 polysaccharide lyase-like protein [Actinomycetospora cinnamomea]